MNTFNANDSDPNDFDVIIKVVETSIIKNDPDKVRKVLVRCSYCKDFKDTNGLLLDSALDKLLYVLKLSAKYSGEISNDIFYTILSVSKSDKQHSKIIEFIKNNFHLFQNARGSYLMAEWLGGCRDKEAFLVIIHLFNNISTELDKENVKTALWEFLDNDYTYEAPEELIIEARNLQKSLTHNKV